MLVDILLALVGVVCEHDLLHEVVSVSHLSSLLLSSLADILQETEVRV